MPFPETRNKQTPAFISQPDLFDQTPSPVKTLEKKTPVQKRLAITSAAIKGAQNANEKYGYRKLPKTPCPPNYDPRSSISFSKVAGILSKESYINVDPRARELGTVIHQRVINILTVRDMFKDGAISDNDEFKKLLADPQIAELVKPSLQPGLFTNAEYKIDTIAHKIIALVNQVQQLDRPQLKHTETGILIPTSEGEKDLYIRADLLDEDGAIDIKTGGLMFPKNIAEMYIAALEFAYEASLNCNEILIPRYFKGKPSFERAYKSRKSLCDLSIRPIPHSYLVFESGIQGGSAFPFYDNGEKYKRKILKAINQNSYKLFACP